MDLLLNLCLVEDIPISFDTLTSKNDGEESKFEVARLLLLSFIQKNFTGGEEDPHGPHGGGTPSEPGQVEDSRQKLKVDSEQLNVNVRGPELLLGAVEAFSELGNSSSSFSASPQLLIWTMRCVLIHQHVLDERTGALFDRFSEIIVKLERILEHSDILIRVSLTLEIVQGFILFKRITDATHYLQRAKDMLDTELKLVSMLGFRTRFQTKPLPQLTLQVTTTVAGLKKSSETHSQTQLPKLLVLGDDTRLEKVRFVNEAHDKIEDLPSLVQCLIIAEMQLMEISQARDNLLEEELKAYLTTLLYQDHGPWSVRFATLLANIKLEAYHKRTVERSLKQCEDLMRLFERSTAPLSHRMSMFFSCGFRPIWVTEVQLGNLMLSLGFVKTALEVFIRIQAWEEVIVCYNMLSLRHKAEEVIRQELEKAPTDRLYCLLGDATDDMECYVKAWEWSGERSACAKRHWGNYLFAKKEFAAAIPHLEKSLEINSLQEVLWLKLGFAALELENWPLAAKAYNRYTQLEPNGFESWNNLAKAYIKMGDKLRAHKILHESLKCNFNNWKVWENFMLVSLDTGNFEDVLNAYKQLLVLKPVFVDKQVLKILVESIAEDRFDAKGVGAGRLTKRAATLVAELCTKHMGDGFYWEMAAKLYEEDLVMKSQKLQKAILAYGQGRNNWSKDPKSCQQMIALCLELADDSLRISAGVNGTSNVVVSQLSSSRLAVQGCYRSALAEDFEECRSALTELNSLLQQLTEKVKLTMGK